MNTQASARFMAGVAGSTLAFILGACTSVLGVSDLPPATDTGDGGRSDATHLDATHVDATHVDAGRDARLTDATQSDVNLADVQAADAPVDAGPFSVSPTSLAFGTAGGTAGLVACGTAPSPLTFTLRNDEPAPITWWSAFGLGASSPYAIDPVCSQAGPCSIGAHSTAMVTITGPSVPATAGMTTYSDIVSVFSSVQGDPGHVVSLREASYGAIIGFSPTDVNFGQQPANQPDGGYAESLQVTNAGNAPYAGTLSVGTVADGGFVDAGAGTGELSLSPTTVAVPPGGAPVTAFFTPKGVVSTVAGAIAIGPDTGTCAPLPGFVTLEAQGTQSPIAVTSTLNFNAGQNQNAGVSCGTVGPTLNVTLTNSGSKAVTVTGLTLAYGTASQFTVPPASSLPTLPPAGDAGPSSLTIPVTPLLIPQTTEPGTLFPDTLVVTTNATGDAPHYVALSMTAAGAKLSLSQTNIVFDTTPAGTVGDVNVTLINSGNVNVAGEQLSFTSSEGAIMWGPPPGVQPYDTQPIRLTFRPTAKQGYEGTGVVSVTADVPVCGEFTGSIDVILKGDGAQTNEPLTYNVTPNAINIGDVQCGSLGGTGQPTSAKVVVNNPQPTESSWTASLSGLDASLFSLSATTGTATSGSDGVFTVSLPGLSSTSGLSARQVESGLYATVTVVIGGDTFTVPVVVQLNGAFPRWSVGSLAVQKGIPTPFSLMDLSRASATVTLVPSSASLLVATHGSVANLTSPLNVTVTDEASVPDAGSISASLVSSSTPLCGPMPAPLVVTGP